MNFLKKTVGFALLSGLMIGNTQANSADDLDGFLKNRNWHRIAICGIKMKTQDMFLHGPLSIFFTCFGVGCLGLPFIRDYSIPKTFGKRFNHPLEDVIIGSITLTCGIAGLAMIYQDTLAVQTENQ